MEGRVIWQEGYLCVGGWPISTSAMSYGSQIWETMRVSGSTLSRNVPLPCYDFTTSKSAVSSHLSNKLWSFLREKKIYKKSIIGRNYAEYSFLLDFNVSHISAFSLPVFTLQEILATNPHCISTSVRRSVVLIKHSFSLTIFLLCT